ncbi:hypothetical protein B0H11DRAFT_1738922, partial [Mycena galericulata]
YLEKGPGASEIRPFLWIIWLALGPLAGSTAIQAYHRISNRILVQVEGLLTELIFEHALRVRVKAHNPEADTPPPDTTSTEGTLNGGDVQSDASSETVQGAPSTTSKDPKTAGRTTTSSIDVGKISNLVNTDLRNVTNMSDFLLLLKRIPGCGCA